MNDVDKSNDDDIAPQLSEDGVVPVIKDPIYDIMSDDEIAERSEHLLELLDEYQDEEPKE